jgi:hypothetical protein
MRLNILQNMFTSELQRRVKALEHQIKQSSTAALRWRITEKENR